MKSTTFRDVARGYQAFERNVTKFVLDANRRLALEYGMSEATIRSFDVGLSRLLKAGSRLERAIRRLPDPSCVPQGFRDRLRREQAQTRALLACLRTFKASGGGVEEALR